MASAPDPWWNDLASIPALVEWGYVYRTVRRRIRVGTWQEPVPGVACRTTGTLTPVQWLITATLYAGEGSAISHASAVDLWGLVVPAERVTVTVPDGQYRPSTARVWIRQSRRQFRTHRVRGIAVTPPARSVLDASLDMRRLADVEQLFGRAVQSRRVSVDELLGELERAPSSGSWLPRQALAGVTAGSRAASEAQLLRLLRRAGLPVPELNAPVDTPNGTRYVDGLWRDLARGVEVDGAAFHLGPREWQADLRRQNAIQTTGIVLLRIAASRLWAEPDAVIAEIRAFLADPRP